MDIKLQLTRTQMEILISSINMAREDITVFGIYLVPVLDHHLVRISDKLLTRMENTRPGRKSKLTLKTHDAGAFMQVFSSMAFNRSTESALIRGIIDEVNRHF